MPEFEEAPAPKITVWNKDSISQLIESTAKKYGIDSDLIHRIVGAESDYNPKAVSKAGAQGLMQLMPKTAAGIGVRNSFDPIQNVEGGVKYFKMLLDKFGGDETKAVAAYNAGPPAVSKYGGVPPFKETQSYVSKVLKGREAKPQEAPAPKDSIIDIWKEGYKQLYPEGGPIEAGKGYLKGLAKGATFGTVEAPAPKTEAERLGSKVGEFVGIAAPVTAATKIAGAGLAGVKAFQALTPVAQGAIETLLGATIYKGAEGAAQRKQALQTIKEMPEEAASWLTMYGGAVGLGKIVPKIVKRFEIMGEKGGAAEIPAEVKATLEEAPAPKQYKSLITGKKEGLFDKPLAELQREVKSGEEMVARLKGTPGTVDKIGPLSTEEFGNAMAGGNTAKVVSAVHDALISGQDPQGLRDAITKQITKYTVKAPKEVRPAIKHMEDKINEILRGTEEEGAAKPTASTVYNRWLENIGKKWASEEHGQAILDDMELKNESPSQLAKTYWQTVHNKLPIDVQQKMEKYLDKLSGGVRVGDVIATEKGQPIYAKTKQDVVDFVNQDLGDSAGNLEGIERGYVALMKFATENVKEAEVKYLHSGVPLKETVDRIAKSIRPPETEAVVKGLEGMSKRHVELRDIQYRADELRKNFRAMKIPEDRHGLIYDALEQPDKYLSQLNAQEKVAYNALAKMRDESTKFAIKTGLLTPEEAKSNYMFHWYLNEKGEPTNPLFGRFAEQAPQLKQRTYATREEAIAAGKIPATNDPAEHIALSFKSLVQAASNREMFKVLNSTETDLGEMLRSSRSREAKPLRLVESWKQLEKQGKTEGYVKYDHYALSKPIVFKDSKGNTYMHDGPVGVVEELFPYVKAYMEQPSYGNLSKINFVSKSLKLMSGFHINSLTMQGLVGGKGMSRLPVYNVVKGLKQIKEGSEDLRILYRNGLEFRGYEATGQGISYKKGKVSYTNPFEALEKSGNKLYRGLGKTLNAVQKFTFDVVHPGIKTNVALTLFNKAVSLKEAKLDRALSATEKDAVAKYIVRYTDDLFSGEDYRTALLQSGQWAAKYYYSPQARKMWQTMLISPQWQKAHLGTFGKIVDAFRPQGWNKPRASLYRGYFYSSVGLYATINLYNMIMTKHMDGQAKFMWDNDGDNTFSLRAPYNDPDGRKVYFRPLKSIFEVAELMPTQQKGLEQTVGKVISKLAPWVQTGAGQIFSQGKYDESGTPARIKDILSGIGTPMPANVLGSDTKAWQSKILGFFGVPTSKDYSRAEKMIFKYTGHRGEPDDEDKIMYSLRKASRNMSDVDFAEKLREAVDSEDLTKEGADTLWQAYKTKQMIKPIVSGFQKLNINQATNVFEVMTPEERRIVKDAFVKKAQAAKTSGLIHPRTVKRIIQLMRKYRQENPENES